MGWTAYYQVVRETPLTETEIASIAEFVRKQRKAPWDGEAFWVQVAPVARPDRVIAAGWNKLAMSGDSGDGELLEDALDELAKLLGGELRVRDDFGAYTRGPKLIDVDDGELVSAESFVPAKPVVVTGNDIGSLLRALAETEDEDQRKQLRASLDAHPAHDVALAIYANYGELQRIHDVTSALNNAQRKLSDPTSMASAFLEAWRHPVGLYFYGDMPLAEPFVVGLGKDATVVAQWTADIAAALQPKAPDIVQRCASVAVQCLCRAGHLRPVIEVIRSLRHKTRSHDVQYAVFLPAHRYLMETKDPRTIPTLLHEIATARKAGWWQKSITMICDLAPERVRPWAIELARRGVHRSDAIDWMKKLGENALAEQLAARETTPLTQRAVDIDRDTRHKALRDLSNQKDPATYISLVLAESLDKFLRARSDYPGLPFSWWDWKGIVEGDGIEGTTAKKLKWYELVGKNRLPPQVIWPEVADIQTLGGAKVAERYASEFLEVPADQLGALEAEEAAILATM